MTKILVSASLTALSAICAVGIFLNITGDLSVVCALGASAIIFGFSALAILEIDDIK